MRIKHITILTVIFIYSFPGYSQDKWVVPEDKANKLSPAEFTVQGRSEGKELFFKNCKSCHGEPGKNNYINLQPPPGDPATEKIQRNNDGELFFKISEGRGQMPSFKNVLSTKEIWEVISFLRSFNNDYVQKIAEKVLKEGFEGEKINIILSFLEDVRKIKAEVSGIKDTTISPIIGAEVKLFAKRYFGNLLLDEPRMTNDKGIAMFESPEDLPGDTVGNVRVIAKLNGEGANAEADTLLKFGVPTHPVSLVSKRAMWNKVSMAPIWLLITYSLAVLAVWGLIFYILLQLRKIWKLGANSKGLGTKKSN